jgi:hypothetical protein
MTAKRRLVPESEVRSMIETLRSMGVQIGAVDIRSDGVTVYPANQTPGNEYDRWKAKG